MSLNQEVITEPVPEPVIEELLEEISEDINNTVHNLPPEHLKLNLQLPVILVDTSYWLYYRYFALRNWYARAYPETQLNKHFNSEHDWLEDVVFMTKYKKLFLEHIKKLCRKFKTKMGNVVFCIDCPHKKIWRCEKTENYKGTRLESHKKNQFTSFNVFSYIKKNLLPELQMKHGVKIIKCQRCEADDVIGNLAVFLEGLVGGGVSGGGVSSNASIPIYILANDNDYLQICNKNIRLINGLGNIISGIESTDDKYIGEKYLISKILLGDVSDNIKCCTIDSRFVDNTGTGSGSITYKNVTKTFIKKILNDTTKLKIFQDMLYQVRGAVDVGDVDGTCSIIPDNKFRDNTILMDFQMLPIELKNNLGIMFREIV